MHRRTMRLSTGAARTNVQVNGTFFADVHKSDAYRRYRCRSRSSVVCTSRDEHARAQMRSLRAPKIDAMNDASRAHRTTDPTRRTAISSPAHGDARKKNFRRNAYSAPVPASVGDPAGSGD